LFLDLLYSVHYSFLGQKTKGLLLLLSVLEDGLNCLVDANELLALLGELLLLLRVDEWTKDFPRTPTISASHTAAR